MAAHPTLYLESRYRKLVRGLPQTIFWCPVCKGHRERRRTCAQCQGFGKLTRDSVQELLARHLLPAFKARAGKFHGAGREDVDVRMLGQGRPFVFEIVAPRSPQTDEEQVRRTILEHCGDRIDLAPFRRVRRERVAFWKEAHFAKIYRALAVLAGAPATAPITLAGRSFAIQQRTPARVAHRRADLEREREVTVQQVEELAPDRLALTLRCAHGTYVKEWVSGDAGRTRPSLPELIGVPCRCEELDVLEILTEEATSAPTAPAPEPDPAR